MDVALASRKTAGSAETRTQFLNAAGALMSERDTIDVPLFDIAERVGLNVALVSYHFGGKEGLLVALAKRNAEEALADLAHLMATDLPPVEKMRLHFTGVIKTFFRYPYLYSLLASLLRDPKSSSALEVSDFFVRPLVEAETAILKQAIDAGDAKPVDPKLFHFAVMGACSNIFSQRATLQAVFGTATIDEALCLSYAETTLDLILNGCLTHPNTRPSETTRNAS